MTKIGHTMESSCGITTPARTCFSMYTKPCVSSTRTKSGGATASADDSSIAAIAIELRVSASVEEMLATREPIFQSLSVQAFLALLQDEAMNQTHRETLGTHRLLDRRSLSPAWSRSELRYRPLRQTSSCSIPSNERCHHIEFIFIKSLDTVLHTRTSMRTNIQRE